MNKKFSHVALAASVALLAVTPAVAGPLEPTDTKFIADAEAFVLLWGGVALGTCQRVA